MGVSNLFTFKNRNPSKINSSNQIINSTFWLFVRSYLYVLCHLGVIKLVSILRIFTIVQHQLPGPGFRWKNNVRIAFGYWWKNIIFHAKRLHLLTMNAVRAVIFRRSGFFALNLCNRWSLAVKFLFSPLSPQSALKTAILTTIHLNHRTSFICYHFF